jgi:hypothetical protein
MPKLWLTYAWKDNEAEQVDYVIQSLKAAGIDVHFDRAQLIPGQKLWPQIDAAISDPTRSDAWALYVTENSLRSEPCQEELAYALDRALRTRGETFPVIGIFPAPLDRSLIPSSIAVRLYVDLRDPGWPQKVAAGARGTAPEVSLNVAPIIVDLHHGPEGQVIEVRPRGGRIYPCLVLVPEAEFTYIKHVGYAPFGQIPGATIVGQAEVSMTHNTSGEKYRGFQLNHSIDHLNSAFVFLNRLRIKLAVGARKASSTI